MSKVTPLSSKKAELCQYCGVVPQSEHPGYSCPRIASFAWADGELSVEYVDLALWTNYTEVMRAKKSQQGTFNDIA